MSCKQDTAMSLNSAAATRIRRLIELPPFRPGEGGFGSADPALHAEARATLLLLALYAHTILSEAEYATVTIATLREAHPLASAPPEAAVAVRPCAGLDDAVVDVALPLRSDTHRKLLPLPHLRLLLWRALQLSVCGRGERPGQAELLAGARALDARFCATHLPSLPTGVGDLVAMRVLRPDYDATYRTVRNGGSVGSLLPSAAGGIAAAGDADRLWWPPCAAAITFAEAQRIRALQRDAAALSAIDEAQRQREIRASAAERRMRGEGVGLAPAPGMTMRAGGGGIALPPEPGMAMPAPPLLPVSVAVAAVVGAGGPPREVIAGDGAAQYPSWHLRWLMSNTTSSCSAPSSKRTRR